MIDLRLNERGRAKRRGVGLRRGRTYHSRGFPNKAVKQCGNVLPHRFFIGPRFLPKGSTVATVGGGMCDIPPSSSEEESAVSSRPRLGSGPYFHQNYESDKRGQQGVCIVG